MPPPQDIPPANTDAAEPAEGEATAESSVDNKAATSLRKESNRQLEYDQSVTHIKHAPFALRRQTVAVVLNASSAPEGGWTAEARAELESMVKSAVGFDERRGDLLTLSVFPFTKPVEIVENTPWWESTRVYELAKMGLFGLVSLLLLFMVVRPAVRNLIRSNQQLMPPMVEPPLALRTEQHPLRGFGGDGAPNILGEFNPLAEIRLPAPGSGHSRTVDPIGSTTVAPSVTTGLGCWTSVARPVSKGAPMAPPKGTAVWRMLMARPRSPSANQPMTARPLAPLTLPPSRPTSTSPPASRPNEGIWSGDGEAQSAIAARAKAVPHRPSSSTGRSPQRSVSRPQGSSLSAMPRPISPSARPSVCVSSW